MQDHLLGGINIASIKRFWNQLPVPSITSISNVSSKLMYRGSRDLRGPAGRIGLRPVAWKPATLNVVGDMLLKLVCLSEDWGTTGWLRKLAALRLKDAGFIAWVAKIRRADVLRHCCSSRVGRKVVAIVSGKGNVLNFNMFHSSGGGMGDVKRPRLM